MWLTATFTAALAVRCRRQAYLAEVQDPREVAAELDVQVHAVPSEVVEPAADDSWSKPSTAGYLQEFTLLLPSGWKDVARRCNNAAVNVKANDPHALHTQDRQHRRVGMLNVVHPIRTGAVLARAEK